MTSGVIRRIMERAREDPVFRQQLMDDPLSVVASYDLTDEERLWVIVPNFGWLIEGKLAGSSRPGNAAALDALHAQGIRALVSLSEEPVPPDLLAQHNLVAVHLPVADFTAPSIAQIVEGVLAVDRFLAASRPVVVHCEAGMGRTGTLLACYLVHQGSVASEAIATVRARRPGSIETPEQEAVVAEYARHIRKK